MNIKIQNNQVKQHELQIQTFSWCGECGGWGLITIRGSVHICEPKDPKLDTPWKHIQNDRLDRSE